MSTIKQGIAEFVAERRNLEDRLRTLIAAELKAFNELTGASVDSVHVGIMEMHCGLGTPTERVVTSVRVSTPLD